MIDTLKRIWKILRGMHRRIEEGNISLMSAGGAFFSMLSLFPALAAVIALLSVFADPIILEEQMGMLTDFVPEQAFRIIENQIMRLISASPEVLGWASVLSTCIALWSARRGTDAMIQALNKVYQVPQRGGVRSVVTALSLTIVLVMVVNIALLTLVVIPVILAFLPLGPFAEIAVDLLRWIVALSVVISGIWVLYRFAPNRPNKRIAWLSPGAVLAITVWGVASWGFSVYLRNFGSYNEIYGSIGAVVVLMMFLYISFFIVVLGATLNAELHVDETVGPAQDVNEGDAELDAGVSLPDDYAPQNDPEKPMAQGTQSK
ncbi:YihY/virulence factor BrkB family protein [Qingshengfaniella alkalisoli]|uniref:YihY/virulence factor BrkB family protein n=1 Tax=Qingshengfaniella alkalisoli TaxID=2599296 RepID=A0A5B8IZ89_9RHOB|nr:YihY/virulence factor BrkB family protein [Qingshengfaniella alkalisoli]QDY69928.1 YihY/virulence factor BrkB family protein [Qingshengfaniella alkalisoli]